MHAFEWEKLLKCHLKGKTCSKLANGLNFYDLKMKLTPRVILTLPTVICMYITIRVKQVYWYISQVSGERLQDHWSSGFKLSISPFHKLTTWISFVICHFRNLQYGTHCTNAKVSKLIHCYGRYQDVLSVQLAM